jgi:hypothetical protein
MIAELFPHNGPIDAPATRFNQLIAARFENIVNFLKLHYCLSRREEPFWRDNVDPESIPERLRDLLEQWRYRPPNRFDFLLDLESFAFFNYQYILYGMEFRTDLSGGRADFPNAKAAERLFQKIRNFGERAAADLPSSRADRADQRARGEAARRLKGLGSQNISGKCAFGRDNRGGIGLRCLNVPERCETGSPA